MIQIRRRRRGGGGGAPRRGSVAVWPALALLLLVALLDRFQPLLHHGETVASAFSNVQPSSSIYPTASRSTSSLLNSKSNEEKSETEDTTIPAAYSVFEQNSSSEDPFGSAPLRPLEGGANLIFEMARKYLIDFEKEVNEDERAAAQGEISSSSKHQGGSSIAPVKQRRKILPRWHPHNGISDLNPKFRTQAPVMNNVGYAKSIWRNVRKRNKPSLWRNALRTYDRMKIMEEQDTQSSLNIYRSDIHHEGAMLACAKLGLWQRALEIYHEIYEQELENQEYQRMLQQKQLNLNSESTKNPERIRKRNRVRVTDNMVVSLVRACCRASRLKISPETSPSAFRRIPLDTAREVLEKLYERHNIPLSSYFINPLAAAYQDLGYPDDAAEIIENLLKDRVAGDEPENGADILNVFDLSAKDKGSYSLLVAGAVISGDWAGAVERLDNMTSAGLYPNQRHVNSWVEVSERKRQPRAVGSWKKKRNDFWLESVK
jgi:tetratricopeptide (TPR) repeat protein